MGGDGVTGYDAAPGSSSTARGSARCHSSQHTHTLNSQVLRYTHKREATSVPAYPPVTRLGPFESPRAG
eukprot:3465968-Prymnesium_polylepis.1